MITKERIEDWRRVYAAYQNDPIKDIRDARREQIEICDLALRALGELPKPRFTIDTAIWDRSIRFESDCIVNGTEIKVGTVWTPEHGPDTVAG